MSMSMSSIASALRALVTRVLASPVLLALVAAAAYLAWRAAGRRRRGGCANWPRAYEGYAQGGDDAGGEPEYTYDEEGGDDAGDQGGDPEYTYDEEGGGDTAEPGTEPGYEGYTSNQERQLRAYMCRYFDECRRTRPDCGWAKEASRRNGHGIAAYKACRRVQSKWDRARRDARVTLTQRQKDVNTQRKGCNTDGLNNSEVWRIYKQEGDTCVQRPKKLGKEDLRFKVCECRDGTYISDKGVRLCGGSGSCK